jgi:hypothetical protein
MDYQIKSLHYFRVASAMTSSNIKIIIYSFFFAATGLKFSLGSILQHFNE